MASTVPPTFPDRDSMDMHVKSTALEANFAVQVARSNDKRVQYQCDRGGHYRNTRKLETDERQRDTRSTRIGCPYSAVANWSKKTGLWTLRTICDAHNHEMGLAGHAAARALNDEQREVVKQRFNETASPRTVMTALVQADPDSGINMRSIYNAYARLRREELNGQPSVQALLSTCAARDIEHAYDLDKDGKVTRLFFCPPQCADNLRLHHHVLLVDCTYKTNRYKMPLLHVIGITPLATSFFAGFAILNEECTASYIWAMEKIKQVVGSNNSPAVFVTDRELALMNAIAVTFPSARRLICTWHINKNITARCKPHFDDEEWEEAFGMWKKVMSSADAAMYAERSTAFLAHLRDRGLYSTAQYIESTWLSLSQHFVQGLNTNVLHFDQRTTSRAEGMHRVLKSFLTGGSGNVHTLFKSALKLIENQHTELTDGIQAAQQRVSIKLMHPFFAEVVRIISPYALNLVHEEWSKTKQPNRAQHQACTRVLTDTMGLPCSHLIESLAASGHRLTVSMFHEQWHLKKTLPITQALTSQHDAFIEDALRTTSSWPEASRNVFRNQVEPLLLAELHAQNPNLVQQGRGRPVGAANKRRGDSLRRDPSAFEHTDGTVKQVRCSACHGVGHNVRTCKVRHQQLANTQ